MHISRSYVPYLIILFVGFACFANTFGNTWTYDDFPVIVNSPDVKSFIGFLNNSYPGRPLRELTYLLDYSLFGMNPQGWHLQNIFWHALNACLIYNLLERLRVSPVVRWAVALLFLCHPLQVEVVANISHRKDSLALAFSLMAVLVYQKAFDSPRLRSGFFTCAFGLSVIAFLAKENAIVLPMVFIAYELAFIPREDYFLLKYRRLLIGCLLAISCALSFWLLMEGGTLYYGKARELLAFKANDFSPFSLLAYWKMVLSSWGFMWCKVFLPTNLAVEYLYPVPETIWSPYLVVCFSVVAFIALGLTISLRKKPVVFFGLSLFVLFWLPTSNLWPLVYFSADRYLYAPLFGILLVFALTVQSLVPHVKVQAGLFVMICFAFMALTWQQNKVWASPASLWTHAYTVNPQSSFVLNNMGNLAWMDGHRLEALGYYQQARNVNRMNPASHYNLGMSYESFGDVEQAFVHYEEFLRINHPMYREQADALKLKLKRKYNYNWPDGNNDE